jgi:hypothetical protein
LPFARYVQLSRLVNEQKTYEIKLQMKMQAHLGWIIYLLQPQKEGNKKVSYHDFLEDVGLEDKKEQTKEDIEGMKKCSLEIANKIISQDKGRKKNA